MPKSVTVREPEAPVIVAAGSWLLLIFSSMLVAGALKLILPALEVLLPHVWPFAILIAAFALLVSEKLRHALGVVIKWATCAAGVVLLIKVALAFPWVAIIAMVFWWSARHLQR